MCVLGLGLRLRPANPGSGVGVCVCLWARSACTPPLLAGVCGVDVGALARLEAAPRHSWLGCWGVCVFVCALRLYPATPCWGVQCGCVVLGWGFGCAPPLLAGVCGVGSCAWARVSATPCHSWLGCWSLYVFLGAPRLYPATPGWGVRNGCVCLDSGLGCAPPLLAGVLGCVCVCWRAPLVPRHSWLRCGVWVCVLGLSIRLRPATPGWGVGVCVCSWARSACTPPLLAGLCGLGVGARARLESAPRHSWLGCWGVCVFVCALRLFPCHSWLRCAVWVCGLGLRFRLRPATPDWGVGCVCVCVGA